MRTANDAAVLPVKQRSYRQRVATAGARRAGLRLYQAIADSYSILAKDGRPDHRIPAHLA
jgi:hypothetical protein